jgi:glycyl-tRNA synthetase alpha chain
MEVTQFTYFQQVGGVSCNPVAVEITYGTERLAMYIQNIDNVFDIEWSKGYKYSDVHLEGEYQFSKYNFEVADVDMLFRHFDDYRDECKKALLSELPLPAYDYVMLASHCFNTLDARKAISVTQRADYILQIRELSKACALMYKEQEEIRNSRLSKRVNN